MSNEPEEKPDDLEAFLLLFDDYIAGQGAQPILGSMQRLMKALKTAGERVEIALFVPQPSASLEAASESAVLASSLNARGSRVARVVGRKGRLYEAAVSADQARELLAAGAVEK
jgi:hypothetical protein